jgi:hypothetical protein
MSRKNEAVDGVFTKLHNSYLDVTKRRATGGSKDTEFLEDLYKDSIEQLEPMIKKITIIEQLLLQQRTLDNPKDIKLGIQDDYVFAMCPFFRNDKKAHDIRVYPGKISTLGSDLQSLHNNKVFMEQVMYQLKLQMQLSIQKTRDTLINHTI